MRYLVSLIFIFLRLATFAQEFTSFNITQQQGLPSNTVYDVFQDSKGFLWVATENGIARYNR
jgi:ligand-binding sensor domain-containing protein